MIAAAALALALAGGSLAAAPLAAPIPEERAALAPAPEVAGPGAGALRDDDDWGARWDDADDEDRKRLFVGVWGGTALGTGGEGDSASLLGGEIAWAFRAVELGLAGYGYRGLRDDGPDWTPVALLRVTQRFPTRGGLDAGLTFGLGAGKPDGWRAWYQVALGGRLLLGPLYLSGEVGFEQYDLVRLAAGLGAAF